MSHALPLVSIVTPSYNQGRFIEDTLRSVQAQDYPRIEHIVVDGLSTDETLNVLKRYEGAYPMRWISEPDQGQSDAIRKGFLQARGEILAWINSDDIYLPHAISSAVATFQRYPDVDLVYGDVWIVDEDSRVIGDRMLTRVDRYDMLGMGNCLAQPATFWTRRIYDRVGGVDARYYFQMDLDFYVRVSTVAIMKHIKAYLARIRMHRAGKMSKAEDIRRAELATLQNQYLRASGIERFWFSRYFLLPRLFIRYALEGNLGYVLPRVGQRILDGDIFRKLRR